MNNCLYCGSKCDGEYCCQDCEKKNLKELGLDDDECDDFEDEN